MLDEFCEKFAPSEPIVTMYFPSFCHLRCGAHFKLHTGETPHQIHTVRRWVSLQRKRPTIVPLVPPNGGTNDRYALWRLMIEQFSSNGGANEVRPLCASMCVTSLRKGTKMLLRMMCHTFMKHWPPSDVTHIAESCVTRHSGNVRNKFLEWCDTHCTILCDTRETLFVLSWVTCHT